MTRPPLAILLATVALACAVPSDVSEEFSIVMDEGELTLTVGDTAVFVATAMRGSRSAPQIAIRFESSDPTVANVGGDGLIRAISVGSAEITASAVGLSEATPATRAVRVLRSVTIDTVRPLATDTPDGRTVSWGELVEITGAGLDPAALNLVFVDERAAPIHSSIVAPPGELEALDTLRIWIPALVPAQSPILLSRPGGSTATWLLNVVQEDVLEPNDVTRRSLSVPPEGLDFRGLAVEVRPWAAGVVGCWSAFTGSQPEECWSDGYELSATAADDASVIVELAEGAFDVVPISVELSDDGTGELGWTVGQNVSRCIDRGAATPVAVTAYHPFDGTADSVVIPMRNVDPTTHLGITLLGAETTITPAPTEDVSTAPYDLRVYPDYRTPLAPDSREENDHCHLASELAYPSSAADLTFDHGRDLDWFSFAIPGTPPDPSSVTERPEREPNGTLASADTLDYGERALGVIDVAGDGDFYAFTATEGDWIDIEVRAERDGASALNSVIQLYFEGRQIALNDDLAETSTDSRITVRARWTGPYVFSVHDIGGTAGPEHTYQVDLHALGPESSEVAIETTATGDPVATDFRPFLQLWRDDRAADGGIGLLLEDLDDVSTVLTPGRYLLLVYNRAASAQPYSLTLEGRPLG